jgi:hypothetical protein
VAVDRVGAGAADDVSQDDAEHGRVVGVADHGQEVRDEVDRAAKN